MSVQVRNGIWCAAAVIIAFMFFLGCSPVGASEGYAHVHDPDDGSVIYVTPTPVPTLAVARQEGGLMRIEIRQGLAETARGLRSGPATRRGAAVEP